MEAILIRKKRLKLKYSLVNELGIAYDVKLNFERCKDIFKDTCCDILRVKIFTEIKCSNAWLLYHAFKEDEKGNVILEKL